MASHEVLLRLGSRQGILAFDETGGQVTGP
jgi:hypothetical protein